MTKLVIDAITNVGNDGSFDVLMEASKKHLMQELKAERITGDKYAEAYISIMNNVLGQAIQFSVNAFQANANDELRIQKMLTEKAQIQDTIEELKDVTDVLGTVMGTVGKQKSVYDAQIKGFKDDALQKAANMMTGVWNLQRSTDEGIAPNNQNMLHDQNIGNAVSALGEQIGFDVVSLVEPTVFLELTDTATASPKGKVSGSVGIETNTIISMIITDIKGAKMIINPADITVTDGNFIKADISLSILAKGKLTATLTVQTADFKRLSATDTATL